MLLVLVLDSRIVFNRNNSVITLIGSTTNWKMKLYSSKYNYSSKINSRYSLINNTLTGAVDIIENNIWHLVEKSKFELLERYPLSNLIERGYLYDNPDGEKRLLTKLYKSYMEKATSRPIRFVFCPSYYCNLNCTYCFEKNFPYYNSHQFMSDVIFTKSIDAMEKLAEKYSGRVYSIELFGGEPLLKRTKRMVKKILELANFKKTSVTIVTNGVNIEKLIDIIYPHKKNIEMIQITVDGPPEIHDRRRKYRSGRGTFNIISKGIDLLLKNNISTNVRINVDNSNIEYLPQVYKYFNHKKWTSNKKFKIQLSLVIDHTSLDYNETITPSEVLLQKLIRIYNSYPELEEVFGFHIFKPLRHLLDIIRGAPNISPKFINCETNLLELHIFCPDGLIYTCPESIGYPEFAIGKFYPDLEYFEDKVKLWKERTIFNIPECRECKFSPICGGGCSYSSLSIYKGDKIPVCERYQEVLDTFLRLRGEKILKKYMNDS